MPQTESPIPSLKIREINMLDFFGEYFRPEEVPAWKWIEDHASFQHTGNNVTPGVWEFIVNLALSHSDIPHELQAIFEQARQDDVAYLLFHQG